MNILKNKIFLAAVILAIGFGIGWLLKPSGDGNTPDRHEHAAESGTWTCSMHPQIRQPGPGKCPICAMDLIPISESAAGAMSDPSIYAMTPEAVALAGIQTVAVQTGTADTELLLNGRVAVDERRLSSVTANFPARIERLDVSFTGQAVRAGERLATVYSPELLTAQRELLEAARTRDDFPELYRAVREKLRLWKLSDEQIDGIERSGVPREYFEIQAGRSGIVLQRRVSLGDYVQTGTVLFELAELGHVWVLIDAYERDLPRIRIGDEVSFTSPALPGRTFSARISYIDPVVDPVRRTVSVRAEASNPGLELKPDMFVEARLRNRSQQASGNILVPATAVLWTGKRSVVYVAVPGQEYPHYEMREITLGARLGDRWEVQEGLQAGEEIVVNGVFSLDAAAQLSGGNSMLNRPGANTVAVPAGFRQGITAFAEAYFALKNALVASDAGTARQSLGGLEKALAAVNTGDLQDPAGNIWANLSARLRADLVRLRDAPDLEAIRVQFQRLSEGVLEMTERFGLDKEAVYREYCPMAFDNKGASWLSESDEILNPYYGDAMLNCGVVEKTYRRVDAPSRTEDSGHSMHRH
jgi:membrane fusion protein, copper/silver efflux system